MANGWGFALQSAVDGYMRGRRYVEDQEDRAYQKEQRERQRKEQAEADALKADLKAAGTPVQVEQTGGANQLPEWADNRDAGSAEMRALPNNGLVDTPIAYQVAGQSFADRQAADAAAAKANSGGAVAARAAETYRRHGQFDKAAAIEASDVQGQAAKLQLANQQFRTDLGKAMVGGHEALAQFATSAEAGQLAGVQARAVPSADGKSVSYATVDKDGNVQPIPGLTFTNDRDGVMKAAFMLDRLVDPAARMQLLEQRAARDQQQSNWQATFNRQGEQFDRTIGLQERSAQRQDRIADMQIQKGEIELKELQSNAKIPPAVKMQVEGWKKEADTINAAIVKAQADGSWAPDSPSAKQLLERRAVISEQMNRSLSPYMPELKSGGDPFGLRGGAAPGKAIPFNSPVWDGAESAAAKKTGVPVEVLRTIRTVGERSNGDQVSPKGAKGVYQFIPSSREAFKKKYGVDAYSDDPNEQALAAAYHLKEAYERTGSWDKAMAGYNGGISGERGTNKTPENKAYSQRTSAALAAAQPEADPMDTLYRKQVAEMNRGTRADLSSDVKDWLARRDDDKKQRFSAAQAAYLQREKDKAQRESRALAAATRT